MTCISSGSTVPPSRVSSVFECVSQEHVLLEEAWDQDGRQRCAGARASEKSVFFFSFFPQ